jgi:hypothetical protein
LKDAKEASPGERDRRRGLGRINQTTENACGCLALSGHSLFFSDREEICREALIRAGFCDILQVLTEPVKIDLKKFFSNSSNILTSLCVYRIDADKEANR